ncbi:uncharacterized protein [Amphiura filiformis]|uniref:uncharacterized protein n=1 Tax=Amphiura filiformis TaxID=82378 RepID=UPI003B224D60
MATNTPSTSTRKDANGVTASKRPPSTSSSVGHSSSDSDDSDSPSAKGKSLKKGKARRKVPKYEKAMRSVKSGISGVQAEADARLEEAIRESLRSQQEWEERQREKELLAMQKFQADMLAAERESMNQLGAIMTSIFGSQQQTAFHQTRPLQRTAAPFNSQTQPLQHNAASYNSQPTSIQYGAPHPAQYETPRRVVPAQTRRLQESTEFSSLLSDTTDVLNL